jgi:predicted enzyme involved in methoxymalonyl-ACP biosynthesis
VYLPTAKNEMVRDFYTCMGFTLREENERARIFDLTIRDFSPLPTKINIAHRTYEPS